MKRVLFCFFLVIFGGVFSFVSAQALHTTDAASDFYRGRCMYQNGNYAGCLDLMRSLLRRPDAKRYYEEADFLIAMSQVRQGDNRVPAILDKFLTKYPSSQHRAEIRMAAGDYYYYKRDFRTAVEKYKTIDLGTLKSHMRDDWCYRSAISFLQTGEPNRAMPLFTALAQNSTHYRNEARYYEGYIHYQQNRYKEARRCLSQVQSSSEYGIDAQYLLTQIDFNTHDYARTIATGERLLDEAGSKKYAAELHRIVGESHFKLNNDKQAAEHLHSYLQQAKNPERSALYISGILAFRESSYPEAINLLGQTTNKDDIICQSAYHHIGLAYLHLHDAKNASLAFKRAAGYRYDETTRETALYNYALCAYETDFSLFDNTIAIFEQFLSEYPQSIYADDINSRLAELYVGSRDYRTALASIDRIKKPSRNLLEARQKILYKLGTEAFADKRIAEAGKYFSQTVQAGNFAPEYRAQAFYWLGECCYRKNAFPQAVKCYRQYLSSDIKPDEATAALAHYNIAYCHFKQHKYEQALSSFSRFINSGNISQPFKTDAYNRIGDCHYYARQYATAESFYAKSAAAGGNGSDYAQLQQAIMTGLQKNNAKKIKLLKNFIADHPQSEYTEDAYNEMGQTYTELNRPSEAIKTYQQLLVQYPQGASARKAALQIGMLYYNTGKIQQSITAYKNVIAQYPSSKEAKVAMEDLKSIYIEQNDIDALTAFMKSQGSDYPTTELDSLTYIAAERNYLQKGQVAALEQYTEQYPNGGFAAQAHYYIGKKAFASTDFDKALNHFTASLRLSPDGEWAEDALARRCEILYMQKQYDKALPAFSKLEKIASSPNNKQAARIGMLRANMQLKQYAEVLTVANKLMTDNKLSPELRQETLYCRATAYRETGNSGKAADDYLTLSYDTRNEYGAESAYRVAQFYYDSRAYDKAEKAANRFIDAGTPHAYWLARNIILLSDIYVAQGDKFKAKQYLNSLQDNYPQANDDIASRIASKLKALEQ